MFEQGAGGRDKEPPVEEQLLGLVCYITVSGFLNGPGFQKMRADPRRDCDEIWVIDCSPEGHQPEVATRIFQGVQHPVCIVLASRSPANDPKVPARVRYRSVKPGKRGAKFVELANLALASTGWSDCSSEPRSPFLPAFTGGWADFVPLDNVLGDIGSGVMPGRTWIIAPDAQSLERRGTKLLTTKDVENRAMWFHPHLRIGQPGDRHIHKPGKLLTGKRDALLSIKAGLEKLGSKDEDVAQAAEKALKLAEPTQYGVRSFDRQWIVSDTRLINQPNPGLWEFHGPKQVFLTAPMDRTPTDGPSLTATALMPDLHHYAGRGGRVFPLWRDAAATQPSVAQPVLAALAKLYGGAPDPVDVFAYVAALLANPAYTATFKADLLRPGLRVP